MKKATSLLPLALLALPQVSEARPPGPGGPRVAIDVNAHEHRERLRPPPIFGFAAGGLGSHELERVDEAVTIDPSSGVVSATVSVTLIAGPGGFESLIALVDEGLTFGRFFDATGNLFFQQDQQPGSSYAQVMLSPPAAPGALVELSFTYAGTMVCPVVGFYASCDFGGERIDFAMAGTLFPLLYDPFDYTTVPYYERNLRISVPSDIDVYASAQEVGRNVDGQTLTVDWHIPIHHDVSAYLALFGDFVERAVPGTSIPTFVIHQAGEDLWVDDIVDWAGRIVPYLDAQAGRPFPYPRLNFYKLPEDALFPGTAGSATSLLSEVYGLQGARYFEETFAHETSHVWWAVLTTESEPSRLLTEGLATYTQIDYTGELIRTDLDKDVYLGRRYNEMKNVSLYLSDFHALPPVVLGPNDPFPSAEYTAWAYLKGATILETLRATIGTDEFAEGLRTYAEACLSTPCLTRDFRLAMQDASRRDLTAFFDQYIYGSLNLQVTIDFTQEKTATGYEASLSIEQSDVALNSFELSLDLADGTTETHRVDLDSRESRHTLVTDSEVLRVRPDRRVEALIRFDSPEPRDVDFDGQLDGADLIRCAALVGLRAFERQAISEGIQTANLDFDARCDVDRDAIITRNDLDALIALTPKVHR